MMSLLSRDFFECAVQSPQTGPSSLPNCALYLPHSEESRKARQTPDWPIRQDSRRPAVLDAGRALIGELAPVQGSQVGVTCSTVHRIVMTSTASDQKNPRFNVATQGELNFPPLVVLHRAQNKSPAPSRTAPIRSVSSPHSRHSSRKSLGWKTGPRHQAAELTELARPQPSPPLHHHACDRPTAVEV